MSYMMMSVVRIFLLFQICWLGIFLGCHTGHEKAASLDPGTAYFSESAGRPVVFPRSGPEILHPRPILRNNLNFQILETRYFSVTLPDSADASKLARRINGSAVWWKEFDLAEELDKLYEEVLETTQLKKLMPKKIKIDFREQFYFLSEGGVDRLSVPAAYIYEKETIYALVKKADRQVLAHEMTHAALHAFAGIRLPRRVDEAVAIWTADQLVR